MDSLDRRANESRKFLLAGVLANLVLALAKIVGGLLGRSHALVADGIESPLDVLSSAMMWERSSMRNVRQIASILTVMGRWNLWLQLQVLSY